MVSTSSGGPALADSGAMSDHLPHMIAHAGHLLPAQGPIEVFVHHNTLHAFEHLPFDQAVVAAMHVHGAKPYLLESRYREKLASGQIRVSDLEAVLLDDLGDEADRLVASFGTRYALRLAMLQYPLRYGEPAELRWIIAETDALSKLREEAPAALRRSAVADTRAWVLRQMHHEKGAQSGNGQSGNSQTGNGRPQGKLIAELCDFFRQQTGKDSLESWSDATWEAFLLHFLWRVCNDGVRLTKAAGNVGERKIRQRDRALQAGSDDPDDLVHGVLIPFCASFLDQGFADWELDNRNQGMFQAFLDLYSSGAAPTQWSKALRKETMRLSLLAATPLESIAESLELAGVAEQDRQQFITQTMLALPGWAGMIWQMESNADWAARPAPAGSLTQYLALRLVLDRLAFEFVSETNPDLEPAAESPRTRVSTPNNALADQADAENNNLMEQRAFQVFQLAQFRSWSPHTLQDLSREQWEAVVREIEAFSPLERRRIFHLAFERKYRNETLDAVVLHSKRVRSAAVVRPTYQLACCIDDREESFRRHLEEVDPECETFGIAGFFGVAMYYRGAGDAHFTPLCPVNIKPQHFVVEEPVYSMTHQGERRAKARQHIGHATLHAHLGTRSFIGGILAGFLGSLAAFPLVARILFPRTTAKLRSVAGRIVEPPVTQLRIERLEDEPGSENGRLGYSVDEMANLVEGALRAMGLNDSALFSRIFIICGHGSSSLNNPHAAAYDCGACGGGRGGPNARAFAQMANDHRVRRILVTRGLNIPDDTIFVSGYHNTCDDSMTWYDLDRLPILHRECFEQAQAAIEIARRRSAHERCRRFMSAELSLSIDDALKHVEGRTEDLSQPRSECGHATNALCFVGRRQWSRGLFLDRRAFLTSYDPQQDDDQGSILERIMQAVIPVCAGINLEYYCSYVDPVVYGCGTNLPHNIASLLGVMDGASSDLRTGLPWQMVEIHEPVRLLFVVETSPSIMRRIIRDNEAISRLVEGDWVQLTVLDAQTSKIQLYKAGEFIPYEPESDELPVASSSIDWYHNQREHLGFATIGVKGVGS